MLELTVCWRCDGEIALLFYAHRKKSKNSRRLRQKGLATIAVSTVGAVVEGKTGYEIVLSDEERESVCSVLTETESDPALRRAFTLLCTTGAIGNDLGVNSE